ncbi:MAG: undecaprenyl/decaprenyl-phosphate alpha-N-acetylglucosaminyl 1-phosphate transferase [Prevotellaceae bacterium]|nr:undecaprenyl/decaprenyl-phosphate alpha-N-acetylglucosaminyl 1-phosphate transferase [Prevotellaceae bacterium]
MSNVFIAILVGIVSMVTSAIVFPMALRFAKKHGIVDNPNARKLQRIPVPVFGGIVVYVGILAGSLLLMFLMPNTILMWGLVAMAIMLGIGIWDDVKNISASLRFLIEILLIIGFISITDVYIDNLHGLWGIHELTQEVGVSLSIFAGVGIVNAINLIDGVDGYSSGYGIMACLCFAIAFWSVWSPVLVCMAIVIIGALVPFFLHNVFGVRSRMFIGDSGTLMLGMLMVVMSFYAISSKSSLSTMEQHNFCIPAFLVAVGCIPLLDTIRVMTMRILRGCSPFKPDKTHLHHLFIDMGFSHLGAALFILFVNAMIVLVWLLAWKIGLSIDIQMYIVLSLGLLVTFGFYKFMKVQQYGSQNGTKLWQAMCRLGSWTHCENKHSWKAMREFVDGPMMGKLQNTDKYD